MSIKDSLKEQRKNHATEGRTKLEEIFRKQNLRFSKGSIVRLGEQLGLSSLSDLFYKAYLNEITPEQVLQFSIRDTEEINRRKKRQKSQSPEPESEKTSPEERKAKMIRIYDLDSLNHTLSNCCHPLPGDEIIAYAPDGLLFQIHRNNCPEAIELMSRFASRVLHVKWTNSPMDVYLGGIKVNGYDRRNMISDIIRVVSDEMLLNIRSFHIDTSGELFEAYISLFVHDTLDVNRTISQLKLIEGITSASRMLKFIKT